MSSVAELQQELIGNYIGQSSEALFLFDYIITLSQEIDVIWSRKWSATTWLYMVTRYSTIIDQIIIAIPPWNSVWLTIITSCAVNIHLDSALELTQLLCLALFSALRVYALLDGKYLVAGVVLLLNLVPVATNMVNYITSTVFEDFEVCTVESQLSDTLIILLSLTTRIAVIIGDVLVLAVTWTKTAQSYQQARRLNIQAPLATMLFRDGTLYFVILLVIYILEILENNIPAMFTLDIIQSFYVIAPPLIICRFLLSLRQAEPVEDSLMSSTQTRSIQFMGNIGQSLQFGGEGDNEEDVEEDRYELGEYRIQTDSLTENAIGGANVKGSVPGEGDLLHIRPL